MCLRWLPLSSRFTQRLRDQTYKTAYKTGGARFCAAWQGDCSFLDVAFFGDCLDDRLSSDTP
jgi:hypothetical protein